MRRNEVERLVILYVKFFRIQSIWEGVVLPKEPTSQVISGLNPELGKLANKLVNKFDLLGRLISVVQCILL